MFAKCVHCGLRFEVEIPPQIECTGSGANRCVVYYDPLDACNAGDVRYVMTFCPDESCCAVLLFEQELLQERDEEPQEADWSDPFPLSLCHGAKEKREQEDLKPLEPEIPDEVQKHLDEAMGCFRGRNYNACAAMCRKAIEAICHEKNCVKGSVGAKLSELCEQKRVIDSKLLAWGLAIRTLGDRGVHPYHVAIDEKEARFALEFASEVARYVFVLNEKYERFKSGGREGDDRPGTDEPDAPESPGEPEALEPPED